jgi:hypothetical protein
MIVSVPSVKLSSASVLEKDPDPDVMVNAPDILSPGAITVSVKSEEVVVPELDHQYVPSGTLVVVTFHVTVSPSLTVVAVGTTLQVAPEGLVLVSSTYTVGEVATTVSVAEPRLTFMMIVSVPSVKLSMAVVL